MSDIFERLINLRGQSVELGLHQVTHLLDHLDHPERDLPVVHVAGTNGKGSTCAMIAAALQRAGHRVGLLTSPHLVDYAERIRVNGRPIRSDEVEPILDKLQRPDGDFDGSFFEVTSAVAMEHFRRRGVDVAVLETGLGGRLDATNVCFPRVTAITSIGLDHVKTLGGDLPSIAAEKAGIIKPGVPVVIGEMAPEASEVIRAIADGRSAPVHHVSDVTVRILETSWEGAEVSVRLPGGVAGGTRLPLPGRHQARNLAVAAYAAHLYDPRPESREALLAGLEDTHWPGRLQRVAGTPVRVYDVAHNQEGMEAFGRSLDELGVPEGSVVVLGVLGDKDLSAMAGELARRFRRGVTATPPHPLRARPAGETADALRAAGMEIQVREAVADACEAAAGMVDGDGWVFVTGSLFTVGAAMQSFGDPVDPSPAPSAANP